MSIAVRLQLRSWTQVEVIGGVNRYWETLNPAPGRAGVQNNLDDFGIGADVRDPYSQPSFGLIVCLQDGKSAMCWFPRPPRCLHLYLLACMFAWAGAKCDLASARDRRLHSKMRYASSEAE
jgi:hypothetical protein